MGDIFISENGQDNSILNFPLQAATVYETFPNLPDVLTESIFTNCESRVSLFSAIHLAIKTLEIEDTNDLFDWIGSLNYTHESVSTAAKDLSLMSIKQSVNSKLFEIYPVVVKINLQNEDDVSLANVFTSISFANELDSRDVIDLAIEIFGDKLRSVQKTEPLKKSGKSKTTNSPKSSRK